jgi:hypothetical protein
MNRLARAAKSLNDLRNFYIAVGSTFLRMVTLQARSKSARDLEPLFLRFLAFFSPKIFSPKNRQILHVMTQNASILCLKSDRNIGFQESR